MKGPHGEACQAATGDVVLVDIYLARHSPAKWIGTVEAVDANAAIAEAAKRFDAKTAEADSRAAAIGRNWLTVGG